MSDDTDEWITIPEAAQRLHVAERQARRLVNRLPETERTAEGVRPAKVRWCPDNVRQMGGKMSGLSENGPNSPDTSFEHAMQKPDVGPDPPAIAPDLPMEGNVLGPDRSENGPDTSDSALIEQYAHRIADKDTEIAFLRAEIERRNVAESELRRLMRMDRDELQKMRAQLSLPEAPAPGAPHRDPIEEVLAKSRGAANAHRPSWIQIVLDKIRGRNPRA